MVASARHARAFVYRGGVRVAGTVVACDASAGSDLVFLSHASAVGARGRRAFPRLGSGRRQLLATDVTLALLGPAGDHLRPHALVAAYGRPFSLGGLRLEVFPSGFMPGAASLLCEGGGRRVVYAGPLGAGPEAEARAADALCLDARHATSGAAFPAEAEALRAVGRAVRELLAGGRAPVLLFDATPVAVAVANALAADRIALRAHRTFVQASAIYRRAGIPASPVTRFAGRLGLGEVLLWPARERVPAPRAGARPVGLVVVGPEAESVAADAGAGVTAVSYPPGADRAGLLRYVEATGAREVALVNAAGGELMQALADRGIDAYALGPPRQTSLFAAEAA